MHGGKQVRARFDDAELAGKGEPRMTEDTPIPRILSLRATTNEDISILLDIRISDADDLVMEGHDIGPRVEEIRGDDDYEYWVTVQKKYKDRLLLNLIKDVFADVPGPSSAYMEWLKEKGMPYDFSSY
jgi:hypothetical protein